MDKCLKMRLHFHFAEPRAVSETKVVLVVKVDSKFLSNLVTKSLLSSQIAEHFYHFLYLCTERTCIIS